MEDAKEEMITIHVPPDLLEALKQYSLVIGLSEGKEPNLSDAIVNLCRIGLKTESQTYINVIRQKLRTRMYENAEVVEGKVDDPAIIENTLRNNDLKSSEGYFLLTEATDEMTEEDAYKNVHSRGHKITLESFRQNYSRYGFSRRGDVYVFKRKVKKRL